MSEAGDASGGELLWRGRQAGAAAVRTLARTGRFFSRPPRWLFHLAVATLCLLVLWSVSVPGVVYWLLPAWLGLAALTILWGLRALAFFARRVRSREPNSLSGLPWFLVAPLLGALTLGLVFVDAPLRARWAWSRSSFERAVEVLENDDSARAEDDWTVIEGSRQLGTYSITSTQPVSGGYLFYEANGAFFNDAGFAYLPDGPSQELDTGWFENPKFLHLGGPWYAWTASW